MSERKAGGETHPCERCKKREVSTKYRFCYECREAVREEEGIRDSIMIRCCAHMSAAFPAQTARDIAQRAFEIANAAVGVRKARS